MFQLPTWADTPPDLLDRESVRVTVTGYGSRLCITMGAWNLSTYSGNPSSCLVAGSPSLVATYSIALKLLNGAMPTPVAIPANCCRSFLCIPQDEQFIALKQFFLKLYASNKLAVCTFSSQGIVWAI